MQITRLRSGALQHDRRYIFHDFSRFGIGFADQAHTSRIQGLAVFEGDVKLFNTQDGGEINFVNGHLEMTAGFETMIFLCLFGGNMEDDGLEGNKKTWWGNLNIDNPDHRYISRFQNLARGLPLTSNNLRRLEDAALSDLNVFKTSGIAEKVSAVASIPARNRLKLTVDVNSASGETANVEFLINWQSYQLAA